MSTYQQLDELIVEAIRQRRNPLYASSVCGESCRLAALTGREEFRVIDGRLQALKRAGKIKFARKAGLGGGWQALEAA